MIDFAKKVTPPTCFTCSMRQASGFSLLEMMLSLAILGMSLAILAQIAGTGTDAAREARDLSQARLIASSKMSEILVSASTGISPAGAPAMPVESMDSAATTQFQVQVDVVPAPMDGMLAIRVGVEALDPDGGPPLATYALTRWMIDPLLGLKELAEEEAALREEAANADSAAIE
ncbi:type II secretion system GspH family protein [Rhodopirellula sp. JC737]|nr:type II secretion system GspH family protein [Rhodopirellula sp. JC737]